MTSSTGSAAQPAEGFDAPDAATGLSAREAAERMAAGLGNASSEATSRSLWHIFRANVLTLFNGIVFSGFLMLLLLGRWQDALFGFAAFFNAIIGVVQEYRAKRSLDRLALLNAPSARVRRDSAEQQIPVAAVVLGDVLVLRAGDQVPADAVVREAEHLEIDESLLTGESDPVDKQPGEPLLSGSLVVAGSGTAIVELVGEASYANQLVAQARRFSLVSSELRSSLDRVLRWITWAIFPVMALIVNGQVQSVGGWELALSTGQWREAAVGAVAAVIAMIPLGLVLMTSIAFAVSAVSLARQQVLVQELPAVEGLARVDVVCLDKTGTITAGEIVFDEARAFGPTPEGWQQVLGWIGHEPGANTTAACLAEAFPDAALEPVVQIPFSSLRKWSAVGFEGAAPGAWVMGAPELVLAAVQAEEEAQGALRAASELAEQGLRVLLLAHAPGPLPVMEQDETAALPAGLRPVALLTFRERVREDAAAALEYFAQQKVAVKVISGDDPRTVAAVARSVGLEVEQGYDARELPEDPALLSEVMRTTQVFGRVTPEQKREMVRALQRNGSVVAMTGDGVNDALAIKEADLGIAMDSAAAATKAVSRIVLLDGRFSRLPGVMAEGRKVIANIERVSMLFLSKTVYAIALSVIFGVMLWGFPFLPRQLSLTDGLTIGIPAFFLALLPNPRRYRSGFLRRSLGLAIPVGLTVTGALVTITAYGQAAGYQLAEIRSASTLAVALIGIWLLMVLSRPFTVWKVLIVVAMVLGLLGALWIPFVSGFFQFSLPFGGLLTVVLLTAAIGCLIVEVIRALHLRWIGRREAG